MKQRVKVYDIYERQLTMERILGGFFLVWPLKNAARTRYHEIPSIAIYRK